MSKKTIFSIVTVFGLTAILLGSVGMNAYAMEPAAVKENQGRFPRFRFNRPTLGSIISLGDNEFTIQRKDGMELTFQVDDETLYRNLEKEELSFDDLKTGDVVTVRPNRAADDASLAKLVIVMPEGFDPAEQKGAHGKILTVETAANTFTLQTRRGDVVVGVDKNTSYLGQLTQFSDLQVGMQVAVVAKKPGENEFIAEIVRSGKAKGFLKMDGRFGGAVTSVGNNQFTIKDRVGETVTIQVTPDTVYLLGLRSKAAFGDIKVGSRLLVTTEENTDGTYTALVVVISPPSKNI